VVIASLLWVLAALVAAALFFASVPHQRLLPRTLQPRTSRAAGCVSFLISLVLATYALGLWSGVFSALTALMFGCVLLPYLNAWQLQRNLARVE
jgi:uncharacterized membrane protein